MKNFIVAKSAGFCFGVSRSVEMAQKLLESGSAYSLGQLIHNDDVVHRFEGRGLKVINSPDELPAGARVMIRSHGVSKAVYAQLEKRGADITDATCPKVKRIHELVRKAQEDGRFVVIIGMHDHPEVEAVKGWCGDCVICENAAELDEWYGKFGKLLTKPITMVVQTTQTRSNFTECASFLKKRCTNLQIFDTICGATSMRQEEAAKLAAECDAMVVIGGKHSANSVHLSVICSEVCPNVQFIENVGELRGQCLGCEGCVLGKTRTKLVFGDGNPNAKVMLVGEGPGEQEDLQGIPFVGRAGFLLDDMMKMIDLDRSRVYIANIVKCRPPHNRDPLPEERDACSQWLKKQIEIVDPLIIICLGRIAATSLIDEDFRITRQHGQWFDVGGRRCLSIYHPSALLRDVSKRPDTFTDLREIRSEIRRLCPEVYE